MMNSFRFWCLAAAAISLVTAALHVLGGGPEFLHPALESSLPEAWKAAFSTIWHEITVLLMLNGVFLGFAALALRKNKPLLWLVWFLNMAFAGLFFGYGLAYLASPWVLLQWIIFACISVGVGLALYLPERLNHVQEQAATPEHFAVLPKATFADTYVVHGTEYVTAMAAARGAFGKAPVWISRLMGLRNALVAPLGLVHRSPKANPQAIGMFPILQDSKDRVVLGLDDRHLDFRVVVELMNAGTSVSLTTLVQPHNVFGKAYLAIIMPFHRIITATILAQAA
jgi:hypothetical protein